MKISFRRPIHVAHSVNETDLHDPISKVNVLTASEVK